MNQTRFHGRRQVLSTIRRGRSVRADGFTLKLYKSDHHRTAVVVSKKVDKRAVVRNKIRRRLLAAIAEARQDNDYGDIAVLVHTPDLADRDYKLLKSQLNTALK